MTIIKQNRVSKILKSAVVFLRCTCLWYSGVLYLGWKQNKLFASARGFWPPCISTVVSLSESLTLTITLSLSVPKQEGFLNLARKGFTPSNPLKHQPYLLLVYRSVPIIPCCWRQLFQINCARLPLPCLVYVLLLILMPFTSESFYHSPPSIPFCTVCWNRRYCVISNCLMSIKVPIFDCFHCDVIA